MNDWKFIGDGIWINEKLDRRVFLNEDYRTTFRAARKARGTFQDVFVNAAGNPIRFRSREAAMRYAETH